MAGPFSMSRGATRAASRWSRPRPAAATCAPRTTVYFSDLRYLADARRFDMGERDHFISMEMAAIGMEMMAHWGSEAVAQRLAMLTERIADGRARASASPCPRPALRAPHILCLGFKDGMPAGLVEGLASEDIHVAPRLGRLRISPHVFNDEEDADRFVAVLARWLRR